MKLLITGCHGFVGGSVARYAAQAGYQVLGIGLASQPEVDWPGLYGQADVAHDDLSALVEKFSPDVLLHAAGTASVGASLATPLTDLRAAVLTWANVLESVRRSNTRPLILFPSSAAVYGEPASLPVPEDAPMSPMSPYGYHKAMCELLAQEYCACFGFSIVVARLFSVYGPRQRRLLVWELFQQAIGDGDAITLKGTGAEIRDYLHIDDLATALLTVSAQKPNGLTILNCGSGEGISVRKLAELVTHLSDVQKPVRAAGKGLPGNPSTWIADTRRLAAFPITPPRPIHDGLRTCIDLWQAHERQRL